MSAFDKHQISTFRFVRCALDAQTGVATLVYAFDQGPELVETVAVPGAPFALGGANATAVQQALQLLHLIAGVSYFKAAVPPNIAIDSYSIDAETAALVQSVYLHGLGELPTAMACSCTARSAFRSLRRRLPLRRHWGCACMRWWRSVAARIRW